MWQAFSACKKIGYLPPKPNVFRINTIVEIHGYARSLLHGDKCTQKPKNSNKPRRRKRDAAGDCKIRYRGSLYSPVQIPTVLQITDGAANTDGAINTNGATNTDSAANTGGAANTDSATNTDNAANTDSAANTDAPANTDGTAWDHRHEPTLVVWSFTRQRHNVAQFSHHQHHRSHKLQFTTKYNLLLTPSI